MLKPPQAPGTSDACETSNNRPKSSVEPVECTVRPAWIRRCQRPWWYGEHEDEGPPPDANEKTEWAFARLKYPSYGRPPDARWARMGNWTIDYPTADRHFASGVRRLSRIHARSEYQVVDLDSPDGIYDWPWIYAVETGHWELTDKQAPNSATICSAAGS